MPLQRIEELLMHLLKGLPEFIPVLIVIEILIDLLDQLLQLFLLIPLVLLHQEAQPVPQVLQQLVLLNDMQRIRRQSLPLYLQLLHQPILLQLPVGKLHLHQTPLRLMHLSILLTLQPLIPDLHPLPAKNDPAQHSKQYYHYDDSRRYDRGDLPGVFQLHDLIILFIDLEQHAQKSRLPVVFLGINIQRSPARKLQVMIGAVFLV